MGDSVSFVIMGLSHAPGLGDCRISRISRRILSFYLHHDDVHLRGFMQERKYLGTAPEPLRAGIMA